MKEQSSLELFGVDQAEPGGDKTAVLDAASRFIAQVRNGIRIPRGHRARPCDGPTCRDMIYDVGKQVVSVAPYKQQPPGVAPTETEDGAGISHFANCCDVGKFRRK